MFLEEITTENAPQAIGAYSQAVKLGDFVFISGQLPINPETNELVEADIRMQTHQVMKNIHGILKEMGLDFHHIVKTTIFVKNIADFSIVNDVYGYYLQKPYPARSTIEVSALPKGALVEIECQVIDTLLYEQQSCGCGDSCGCGNHSEESSCTCGEK